MKISILAATAVVSIGAFGFVAGCDNSEPATTATPSDTSSSVNATLDKAQSDAAAVADKAEKAASDAAKATEDAAKATGDAAKEPGNVVVTEAQKLYDQALEAVKSNNFADAEKYVDQLKALKDKLPADWAAKVDALVAQVSDAKAKLGALPGLPK